MPRSESAKTRERAIAHNCGMFGSRADLVVDLTYLATLLAPMVALASIRGARARHHDGHRRVQVGLLALCWLTVLALEVRIRMAGGSGSLLRHGPAAWARVARGFLAVHITAAVVTYGVWAYLAVVSSRHYRQTLPGRFSRRHKRLGWLIFAGLCFTAVSATGMYLFAFVL